MDIDLNRRYSYIKYAISFGRKQESKNKNRQISLIEKDKYKN